MGHRSNTVIIQHGVAYIQSDHWGALDIPNCLTKGPTGFVPEGMQPADQPSQGLCNSTWCEGFVCVDHDRKQVLFDSGQSEAYREPNVRYFLIQRVIASWPDWSLYFVGSGCGSGIDTIAKYLEKTVEKKLPESPLAIVELPSPAEIQTLPGQLADLNSNKVASWNTVLRRIEGEKREQVYQFAGDPLRIVAMGKRLFEGLAWFEPQDVIDSNTAWKTFRWRAYHGIRTGYVEINSDTKLIRFWEFVPTYATLEIARHAWESDGFKISRLSTPELAAEPALKHLAIPDYSSDQWTSACVQAEQMLGKNVVGEMVDSFKLMVANLQSQGHSIEYINPSALES